MISIAPELFQPLSRGFKLDPNEFGFLTDSSPEIEDITLIRDRMRDDGYLFLKGFFKRDDVLAIRQVMTDRLLDEGFLNGNHPPMDGVLADVKVVNKRSAFSATPNGDTEVKAYDPNDLIKENQPLFDLLGKGHVMDFFGDFFGTPALRLHHIWFRAVGTGMGTPPHCDWVYMSRGSKNLYTTWVPIGDTPLQVGGLMILENSHKKADRLQNYFSRDVDDYCTNSPNADKIKSGEMLYEWDGVLTKNPYTLREKLGDRWLTAEYEAGDLLVFTRQTIHASLDNQSDRIRISVDTRYQPANEPADERWMVENSAPYAKEFKKGRIC